MKSKSFRLVLSPLLRIGGAVLFFCVLYSLYSLLFIRNRHWITQTGSMIENAPVFYTGGRVFFTDTEQYYNNMIYSSWEDVVVASSAKTGKELWRHTLNSGYVFATPLSIVSGRIYIGDTAGTLHVLNARSGKVVWTFLQPPTPPNRVKQAFRGTWFGKLVFLRNLTVIGGKDGAITALFQKTGKTAWSHQAGSAITALETSGGMVFAVGASGEMVAISPDGRVAWRADNIGEEVSLAFPHKDNTLASFFTRAPGLQLPEPFTRRYLSVVTLDKEGVVTSRDMRTGKIFYTSALPTRATSPPAVWSDRMFVGLGDSRQQLGTIDLVTGKLGWMYENSEPFKAKPVIGHRNILLAQACDALSLFHGVSTLCATTVFVGDTGGDIHAIRETFGSAAWKFHTSGPITSPVGIHNNHVVAGNLQGDAYTVFIVDGKLPKKIGWRNLNITQNTSTVEKGNVFEATAHYEDDYFPHPWDDITVVSKFMHESGKIVRIDGYFYDKNTWKITFNPTERGAWTYVLDFILPDTSMISRSGAFVSTTSSERSYLKAVYKPGSVGRLTADGHTAFSVLGIGDAGMDVNCNGNLLDDYSIGGTDKEQEATSGAGLVCSWHNNTSSFDDYLATYGDGSKMFNTFRWSVDNASFTLANQVRPGKYMLLPFEAKAGDKLAKSVVSHGYHLWMTLFNNEVPNEKTWKNSPIYVFLAKRYIKDVVARYGAYVSVWELTNEGYTADPLIHTLARYLRSLDHEERPITTSWVKEHLTAVDIISPHWYDNEDSGESDIALLDQVRQRGYDVRGKPIVFGEIGNKVNNWDTLSATRMRVRTWTALMNNIGLIFWNQSPNKYISVPSGSPLYNANQYIGQEERAYVRVLNVFAKNIRLEASGYPFAVDDSSIRAYGLVDNNAVYGYFHRFSDYTSVRPASVSFVLSKVGTLEWYDTKTGLTVAQKELTTGRHTLQSPPFLIDIAVKITTN